MTETWKAVVGFEGCYEVSDQGRVRSLDREMYQAGYVRRLRGRVLKATANAERGGYRYVTLCVHGYPRSFRVAVLVASAFIGPRPAGLETCHKDGCATRDIATNLEYKTHAANVADMAKHGTTLRGEMVGGSRLKTEDVLAIRAGTGTQEKIAATHGVSRSYVSMLRNKRRWVHV